MKSKIFYGGIMAMALGFSQTAFADHVYTIYPTPQQQVALQDTTSFATNVTIVAEAGIDDVTKKRIENVLKERGLKVSFSSEALDKENVSNIYLGINGSEGIADKKATEWKLDRAVFGLEDKYDRHCLSLTSQKHCAQMVILGENTDAVFYGIASLEQILDATPDPARLPCVNIYDYADQKSRGIVEGYYGYPYTVEVKKDLMRFMMRYKMNTYMYGAKSDPYHSQYWKNPYPTRLTAEQAKNGWLSQDMVKDITQVSHETKVNFIWAIHPGNDIINSNSVVRDVTSKFDKMYQLGVRQFAVFVDDVGIPNSDDDMRRNATNIANIQKSIENKYNRNYQTAADTVKPLHLVPQVYCTNFAENGQRKRFFKALSAIPENITVYTTGRGVWSVPNQADFNTLANEFGRPGAWWWNYPCNDNADAQVYPMDMYSNFFDMPAVDNHAMLPKILNNGLGIVCNPMQQGEISKIPLFSAADYAWNTSEFNNIKSWNAAFPAIVGAHHAESLQLLAKYLRWNDPEELNSFINKFKSSYRYGKPNVSEFIALMNQIQTACTDIKTLKDSDMESDRLLYKDLAPWLLKLEQMAKSTEKLLEVSAIDNENPEKWDLYVEEVDKIDSLQIAEEYKAYALEGMGNGISVSVRPAAPAQRYFYPFVNWIKENVLVKYFPDKDKEKPYRITNIKHPRGGISTSKGVIAFGNSTNTFAPGEYFGIALPHPTKLKAATIADTLLANNSIIISQNGKHWKKVAAPADLLEDYLKYVCIENATDSPKTIKLGRNSLNLQLPEPVGITDVTIPNGPIWQDHNKSLLIDGDYTTFVCLNQCQRNGDQYTIKLEETTPIHDVRICMGTVNGDHMNTGQVLTSKDGKSWNKIVIKGTNDVNFQMNHRKVVKYSDEMSYCDFDGKGKEALYVRFNVVNPRTDKWLRFYEMEVNKQYEKLNVRHNCTDHEGLSIEALDDRLGYTHINNAQQSITCHFNEINFMKSVVIYQKASASASNPANIKITADGKTWTDLGLLVDNRQVIDLTDHADAIALKIEWSGNAAPDIYEIVPVTDETKSAEVTKIEEVTVNNEKIRLAMRNKVIDVQSAEAIRTAELYTLDGKKVINYEAGGMTHLQIPMFHTTAKAYLIQIVLNNGQKSTFKIAVK